MEKERNFRERVPKAHYPLSEVRRKIVQGDYFIQSNALDYASNDFGWTGDDIVEAYKKFQPKNFYKSMPSLAKPGHVLDVYRARINGEYVYTHFYIDSDCRLIINSFKQDDGWKKEY